MTIIRSQVPSDSINIGTVDLNSEEGFHFDLDGFLMPETRRAILPHFKGQHPMLDYARRYGLNPPLRFVDFSTRREFEETGLYRECYRGYTHSMLTFGIEAPPDLNISMVLSRAHGDFSEKDKQALQLLQPVVSTTFHCLFLQNTLQGGHDAKPSSGTIIGTGRNVVHGTPVAIELLREFHPGGPRNCLPAEFRPLLRRNRAHLTTLTNPYGLSLAVAFEPGDVLWTLRLWKNTPPLLRQDSLRHLGLTLRQIEILQWVAHGKTNAEIALILGISYRTVQKHLENCFRILGVENRMAAVACVRDPVGTHPCESENKPCPPLFPHRR